MANKLITTFVKTYPLIPIGEYSELTILRETSVGLYLGDDEGEDVLLPNKYVPDSFEIDDVIKVFVYLDYDERKVATTLTPKIFKNQFAMLEVTAVSEYGAFLDWGLEKNLIVPFREQRKKLEEGRWYIVFMTLDKKTDRLFASNKIERYLQNDILEVDEGDEVNLMVMQDTDIGYTVIVNNMHKGLVYNNEVFKELNIGDRLTGYVKKVREENKLDISLQPIGYQNFINQNSEIVYNTLLANDGFLKITDKSPPEEIYLKFSMSKKAFKKAVGDLYKQRKILLEDSGMRLVK